MRFQLISDNTDAIVGMRLAGVSGVMVRTKEEAHKELLKAVKMEDVAIILITRNLAKMCKELVYDIKMRCHKPLIVEIPDGRPSDSSETNSIMKYVRDAIGVKF